MIFRRQSERAQVETPGPLDFKIFFQYNRNINENSCKNYSNCGRKQRPYYFIIICKCKKVPLYACFLIKCWLQLLTMTSSLFTIRSTPKGEDVKLITRWKHEPHTIVEFFNIFPCVFEWKFNAGCTLCMNLNKSHANHESCIVYTLVIRMGFVPDLLRDSQFVNSQPLAVFARTIKGHELDLHWFVCDAFISIHYLRILEVLFWKFLNSSWLINYQLIGFWLFVMVRRWLRESWIWWIHE